MKTCSNCGYERQLKDDVIAPPTACPQCGFIYKKIGSKISIIVIMFICFAAAALFIGQIPRDWWGYNPKESKDPLVLAKRYYLQGQYEKAEELYKSALTIKEKSLGPDDPSVAIGLNNLSKLYIMQRQYEKAEPLYKRALEIREKALGLNHPDAIICLHRLAAMYRITNQNKEAADLERRAARTNPVK
jgi:tetratricopeptide (TPR) repeat protein